MNNTYRGAIISCLLFAGLFTVFIKCNCIHNTNNYTLINGFTQGTSYHIKYQSSESKNFSTEIEQLLSQIDHSLSIHNDSSLISKFNRAQVSVLMDSHFKNVVIKAFEVHKATNGLFDITVGPLVEAWGFGKNKAMEADTTIIDSLLKFTGMDKIYIDKNKLFKKDERVQLNANAIAQGYSVDVICQYLDSKNIKNYMVEIGGEVRVKGKNPKNKLWKIGIDKPFDNNRTPGTNLQAILKLHNMSAATSGNYRKYIIKNGIKYVHSINPQTGYPVMHNLLSVTIITPKSITGDAYATACMVAGLEIAKKIIFNHDELEAYLIYSDKMGEFKVYKSSSMAKYLHK